MSILDNTRSKFFNYNSTVSIVLFVSVDANYNFLYANAGSQKRISNCGVFKNCSLCKTLMKYKSNFPELDTLNSCNGQQLIFFPNRFRKCILNDRYKGHLTIDYIVHEKLYVFGSTSAVFRELRKPMFTEPTKAEIIVMTIVHLHNYLGQTSTSYTLYMACKIFEAVTHFVGETNKILSPLLPL